MNITSLLITFAGIIFIFALYLMSRIAQSKLPKDHAIMIPDLKDDKGNRFTSILDDIPARDGSTPTPVVLSDAVNDVVSTSMDAQTTDNESTKPKNDSELKTKQHILFISAQDETGLDGNLILSAFAKNGLVFGDMDIFHYFVDAGNESKTSLFRVANGMEPWTLKQQDLQNKKLAGLSIVLLTPSKINDKKAIKTFIDVSKKLAKDINGIVKNKQQQMLTKDDESILINSI
jgi:cell division protein ZipA